MLGERSRVQVGGISYVLTVGLGTRVARSEEEWFFLACALRWRDPDALDALGEVHAALVGGRSPPPWGGRLDARQLDALIDDLELAVSSGRLAVEVEEHALAPGVASGPAAEREAPRPRARAAEGVAPNPPAAPAWHVQDVVKNLSEAAKTGAAFWAPCERCGRALEGAVHG